VERLSKDLGIGRERMAQILSRWPPIAQLDLDYITLTVLNVAALLHCRPVEAALAIAREHRLLHTPLSTLRASFEGLAAATQHAPHHSLCRVLLQSPKLLYQPATDMQQRLQDVAAVFGVPVPQLVIKAANDATWLLHAPPDTVRHRIQRLTQLLGLPAGPSLLSHPRLVCLSSDDVARKLQQLGEGLHLKPSSAQHLVRREPRLLNLSAGTLAANAAGLQRETGLPLPDVQQMVFQEPSLLARAPGRVGRKLAALQQLLACGAPIARQLVLRRPALLTRSLRSLSSSLRALSVWRMSPAYKAALIHGNPSLLRLSSQEVHGRCRWLRTLMFSNAYFHSALRNLPPKLLGVIILHLPTAWSRLQYLVESSQEGGLDIMQVVQARRADFSKAHPGYARWLAWKCVDQVRLQGGGIVVVVVVVVVVVMFWDGAG
jgi:hypothetical protein